MTRRELVRAVLLTGAAGALRRRELRGQQAPVPPPTPPAPSGDRLYDPRMVQERAPATALDNDPEIKALEHRLKCTCGCNLDIYTCRTTDFTCTYSPALHREVLELRGGGKNPEQIVAAFVEKYGERVLMAPEPEGFNLAGYLLPGALVATAGALLAAVLLRRSRRAAPAPVGSGTASAASPDDEERLRRALAEVED